MDFLSHSGSLIVVFGVIGIGVGLLTLLAFALRARIALSPWSLMFVAHIAQITIAALITLISVFPAV
jgi:hypothetical protein